ncbi:MAG: UDP-N-acetylglucosamine 2-epimerase (non-hydrolyzing), partial [Actinobacteria bacterium]|nr:UDP-N-acetylglucosamine 2-epimerase (non-hydrolyzing) [Actinomycetota bacterium]
MKRVLVVFGTRPEAIKMAPVVHELNRRPQQFSVSTCVTAQHREMLDQVLGLFEIKTQFDLNLMTPGQDLSDLTSRVLLGMRDVLSKVKPDFCLVHGDTTTTLATSLAAFYQKIPVGHVEAGLRTYQPYAPFPEEINRTVTGRIASYHFAPTDTNRDNLLREGVAPQSVVVTGNTVIDSLLLVVSRIKGDPACAERLTKTLLGHGYPLSDR